MGDGQVPGTGIEIGEDELICVDEWGLTIEDALIFLSVAGDASIAQSCHPSPEPVIAPMRIPKIFVYPTPFRKK
jgi:amidase